MVTVYCRLYIDYSLLAISYFRLLLTTLIIDTFLSTLIIDPLLSNLHCRILLSTLYYRLLLSILIFDSYIVDYYC